MKWYLNTAKSPSPSACHCQILRILIFLFFLSHPVINVLARAAVGRLPKGWGGQQLFFCLARKNLRGKQTHSFPTDKLGLSGEGRWRLRGELGLSPTPGRTAGRLSLGRADHIGASPETTIQHQEHPASFSKWTIRRNHRDFAFMSCFLLWGQGGEGQSWQHPCRLLCLPALPVENEV